jgi:hypothetical protein
LVYLRELCKLDEVISLSVGEERVRQRAYSEHKPELDRLDRLFNALLDGFNRLPRTLAFGPSERYLSILLRLATRSINSLLSARLLLERGYFSQALTLRSAAEDWIMGGGAK